MDSEYRQYTRYFSGAGQRGYQARQATQEAILVGKRPPYAACGCARRENLFETMVCTRTLYNYIDQRLLRVRNNNLPLRVRRKVKRNRQRTERQFSFSCAGK